MKKKNNQQDQVGYKEGYRTGLSRGYKVGVQDALKVAQDMLEDNGINLSDTEFYSQFDLMLEEGTIRAPDEK